MAAKHLIDFFLSTNLFNKKELRLLNDKCCDSPMVVIDFEEVVKKVYAIIGGNQLSSVDAMIIDSNCNIHLIEMKGMTDENFENKIDVSLAKSSIQFHDTLKILFGIIGCFDGKSDYIRLILTPKEVKIYPYLISDVNSQTIHKMEWSDLRKTLRKPSSRFSSPISILNCITLEKEFEGLKWYF